MTVILAFMAAGLFVSLFVAHLASKLSEALLAPRRDRTPEIDDRLARDQRYSKLL